MFLEKLEIQGFKSFANKNILVFPGMVDRDKRGITAVVGPNGSGKSNVADAVRWALGEQSMKTLRGKKSEDIIFSGSEKKGKLGMAEVSLHLNNEDRQAPLDYSQVVITRRLFRSGESEYLLNNGRVRLADIQMMLAKANFGQKTYSVIGQGMVEGFLNTSLAERKEFFDEATGVKQYQIKREDSLNKLRSSYENLIQAQMLLTEIEPRLKSLTRQVNRLQKREQIEKDLRQIQTVYYGANWQDINNNFNKYNKEYLRLEKEKISRDKKMVALNAELKKFKQASNSSQDFDKWQADLNKLQTKKDELNRRLAKLEAQLEIDLEAKGQFDVSFLLGKKDSLFKTAQNIKEEIKDLGKSINHDHLKSRELNNSKLEIDKALEQTNASLKELGSSRENSQFEEIQEHLDKILKDFKILEDSNNLKKLKNALNNIKDKIKNILAFLKGEKKLHNSINKLEQNWTNIHEKLQTLSQEKEELINKINDNNLRMTARGERIKLLKERFSMIQAELAEIEKKLAQNSGKIDAAIISKDRDDINKQLSELNEEISKLRDKISRITDQEEDTRNKFFDLQHNIQNEQNEINKLNAQLQEIKINSTRYETKLEDLETEIRDELGGIKEVREYKQVADENQEEASLKERIVQLKRQLELIGGIDPHIEEEYNKTKERFDFLDKQVVDLNEAIESLQKIIKELDLIIKERFDKEFKVISEKFSEYFKILFNGGKAKILKVMETPIEDKEINEKKKGQDDVDSNADLKKVKFLQKHNATGLAGIEIQASPPGKKIKTVTMLSGGERALTAVALICAIISSNPSPFVVLDEVDAALDEANSERLAEILDELSYKTQFIAITHNRATMRRANILYGVTMGDDGVSKLLSIKLEEVKAK